MTTSNDYWWKRFQALSFTFPEANLTLDLSRVGFGEGVLDRPELMAGAFRAMAALERGAVANPDEGRMVGHYWLRAPELAPTKDIQDDIRGALRKIKAFAKEVHSGKLVGASGVFKHLMIIGIGGSALGPQFVANALGTPASDRMRLWFLDNTDPDGIDRVIEQLGDELGRTLCVVISKSGGTKETRNGMLEAKSAFADRGLDFTRHAVAITKEGSELSLTARREKWLRQFPMWDWVGGRTSETSAVGLLPAALQGIDIDQLLAGAAACDRATRIPKVQENPAALLALAWFHCTHGVGQKNMVILPYKDRLDLLAKYLQQLIMESLGKSLNVNGLEVFQGIAVLGNKGSTDQHSYVQQLVDGVDNAFVTFVQVMRDRVRPSKPVEPDITSGDYLKGFLLGTREALQARGRDSITITIPDVTPATVGCLIALYERAVGFYATLVNINAYHQPGVEAGKLAAGRVILLTQSIFDLLRKNPGVAMPVSQIVQGLGASASEETVFHICEHLAANPDRGLAREPGPTRFQASYRLI
jgi:glucose-6-phosphate isomerase